MVLIYPLIPISSYALKDRTRQGSNDVHPGYYRRQSIGLLGKSNFQQTGRQNGLDLWVLVSLRRGPKGFWFIARVAVAVGSTTERRWVEKGVDRRILCWRYGRKLRLEVVGLFF
uniref:Putative ovule protein n=1 Tax=Solanum chacoense TaxID=4108 RepID=A0A0V0HR28_SOLCH